MKELISYFEHLGVSIEEDFRADLLKAQRKVYSKGDYILKEGQYSRSIDFVVSGRVRHFYNLDGQEYTRWVTLKDNFVTAFTSFINQVPSPENLECLEDTELLCIPRDHFLYLRKRYTYVNDLWTQGIEKEMIGYEARVSQLIISDSEKRYKDFLDRYPDFVEQVPQKYIASMLGIAPRHLSRIRNKLAGKSK